MVLLVKTMGQGPLFSLTQRQVLSLSNSTQIREGLLLKVHISGQMI